MNSSSAYPLRVSGWWSPSAVPVVVALAVLGAGVPDLAQHYRTEVPALALALLRAAPLLLLRRTPRLSWLLVVAGCMATALLSVPLSAEEPWPWPVSSVLAVAAAVGGVAVSGPRALAVGAAGSVVAAGAVLVVLGPVPAGALDLVVVAVFTGSAVIVGDLWQARRETGRQLAVQQDRSAAERERRHALEQRARIARELHDVVAHHLSLIAVQAASAPVRVDDLSAAGQEFTTIAASAREGLEEMRRLLAVLRPEPPADSDSSDPSPAVPTRAAAREGYRPQPGLAELADLAARTRAAGVGVRLEVDTDPAYVAPTIALDVHRIVQEALSNVVRHAPGAQAAVTVGVERDGQMLLVEVSDDGRRDNGYADDGRRDGGTTSPAVPPGGAGLVGMRERVHIHGGTLHTDVTSDGGFVVIARLPLVHRAGGPR